MRAPTHDLLGIGGGIAALTAAPTASVSAHPLARLVGRGGSIREESRGGHFRTDYPFENPALARHVVHRPGEQPTLEEWI